MCCNPEFGQKMAKMFGDPEIRKKMAKNGENFWPP